MSIRIRFLILVCAIAAGSALGAAVIHRQMRHLSVALERTDGAHRRLEALTTYSARWGEVVGSLMDRDASGDAESMAAALAPSLHRLESSLNGLELVTVGAASPEAPASSVYRDILTAGRRAVAQLEELLPPWRGNPSAPDFAHTAVTLARGLETGVKGRVERRIAAEYGAVAMAARDARRAATAAALALFLLPLLMAGTALLLIIPTYRSLRKHLADLARSFRQVARGEARPYAGGDGPQELQTLAAHFNTMVDELEATNRQLATAREQLERSQKMEAMGRLAAGVAHDFNNLLTIILTSAELVELDLDPGSDLLEPIRDLSEAGRRAKSLTRQLLLFSSTGRSKTEVVDVSELAVESQKMLGRLLKENVTLRVEASDAPLGVRADPTHLEQIILNLTVNAADAMPDGGLLTLRTHEEVVTTQESGEGGPEPGAYAVLTVEDTGVGIPESLVDRIFEPFFTTKGEGTGTGLGLATVYGIVHRLGGTVQVASQVGRGTIFTLHLPLVAETRFAEPRAEPTSELDLTGTETILVVEDEDRLRDTVMRGLENLGYRVIGAANGQEALAIARNHAEDVSLILTDLVMPVLGGWSMARRLGYPWSPIRVLFMSGYVHELQEFPGGRDAVISKPFQMSELARRLRSALDSPPPPQRSDLWLGPPGESRLVSGVNR
ncbi:MAG: ATP-binding protein [Gemmatimonadota bacterium]